MKKIFKKLTSLSLGKKYYLSFFFSLCLWSVFIGWKIISDNNTDGIFVSNNYELLECDREIKLYISSSASNLEKKNTSDMPQSIKEEICSLDHNFDNSISDRTTLFSYSLRILEFWTVSRPDIAQYFYRKIISANENDALSLYIKQEKLK